MQINRRSFLSSAFASASALAMPGCCSFFGTAKLGKPALQLYSIRQYIGGVTDKNKKVIKAGVGLEKGLADTAALGYKGVEFAGYYGFNSAQLKKMLDDNGLVACGTHISNELLAPEKIKETIDFNLGYGNKYLCCPGGGNMPKGIKAWSARRDGSAKSEVVLNAEQEDFVKRLCDYYNKAAETAAGYGCMVGLHNHTWEFGLKFRDGTRYWDYFFSHTDKAVQMEQDVGWTTCAGFDPCEQFKKYPHRSFTLHAKENGMGPDVKEFDAILGQPGKPGAVPVDWDRLFKASDEDGVEWYVVECEKHCDSLMAAEESFNFLKSKGRC